MPNFLIIGAQKSGTSWFAKLLSQHPEIYVARNEIHFFDKTDIYQRGIEWYCSFFPEDGKYRFVGEKTPDYLWANGEGWEKHAPDVHRKVHSHLADAKLIVILRNPVERAVSALNHVLRTGRVSPLLDINRLLAGDKADLVKGYGIIEKGMYYDQIRSYLDLFDPKQMLILIYEEDVVGHPVRGLEKACEFLGASRDWKFQDLDRMINEHNRSRMRMIVDYYIPFVRGRTKILDRYFGGSKVRPNRDTIDRLYDIYAPPNRRLFDLLGRDVTSWSRSS